MGGCWLTARLGLHLPCGRVLCTKAKLQGRASRTCRRSVPHTSKARSAGKAASLARTMWMCRGTHCKSRGFGDKTAGGAHHAGSEGLQAGLQCREALLGGTLLPTLSVAQRSQLLAQPLCHRLSLNSGRPFVLQCLLSSALSAPQ